MGIDVPIEPIIYEDDKAYLIQVDIFEEPAGCSTCDSPFLQEWRCCVPGSDLNAWIDGSDECTCGGQLCPAGLPATAQRLKNVSGPYPDIPACRLDL